MRELITSLKALGWSDKLIAAYMGKQYETIPTITKDDFKASFFEVSNLIIDDDGESARKKIFITVK